MVVILSPSVSIPLMDSLVFTAIPIHPPEHIAFWVMGNP